MDIMSAGSSSLASSIQDLGNLLKSVSAAKTGLDEKMMNVSVIEQVSRPGVGENIDFSA